MLPAPQIAASARGAILHVRYRFAGYSPRFFVCLYALVLYIQLVLRARLNEKPFS